MKIHARAALAALLMLALWATSPYAQEPAGAAGSPTPAGEDAPALEAARVYQSRDYAAAAVLYEALVAGAPNHPLYIFLLAKCRSRTGRPEEALELIDRAVRAGLNLDVVAFERGRAFFVAERYPEAIAAYEEYHRLAPGDAYSRIAIAEALLAAERFQDALDELAKVTPDPETRLRVELLTAAALTGLNRGDEAVSRLQGALSQDFTDAERVNISGTIDLLKQPTRVAGAPGKPWWVNLTSGLEYDTNVPTAGKQPKPRNPDFADRLDAFRGTFSIDGGYRWQATDRFTLTSRLFTLLHTNDQLSERDIFLYRISMTPEYRIFDRVSVGVDSAWSHLWLDQVQLNNAVSLGGFVTWRATSWTASRVSYNFRWETFYDDNVFHTEDLDGAIDGVQFTQDFFIPETTLVFRLSYSHENSHTDGSDFDYDSDAIQGAVSYVLPLNVRATASYQHVHTTYHHPNFRDGFVDRRVNNTQIYSINLSRPIVPGLDASLYYTLTDAESNVKDFDFDRNVFGFSLTYGF